MIRALYLFRIHSSLSWNQLGVPVLPPVSPPPPSWLSPPGLSPSSYDGRITMMEAFQLGHLLPLTPMSNPGPSPPVLFFPPCFLGGKSSPSALLNPLLRADPTKEMLALPCCHGHTTQTAHHRNPPAAADLICLRIAFAARYYSFFIYICPETA